jgi:hypothetical protein
MPQQFGAANSESWRLRPKEKWNTQEWRDYEPTQEISNYDSFTLDSGFGAQSSLGRFGGMG